MATDYCPYCGGNLVMSSVRITWEAYCTSCGRPTYLDDNFDPIEDTRGFLILVVVVFLVLFLIAAYAEVPH